MSPLDNLLTTSGMAEPPELYKITNYQRIFSDLVTPDDVLWELVPAPYEVKPAWIVRCFCSPPDMMQPIEDVTETIEVNKIVMEKHAWADKHGTNWLYWAGQCPECRKVYWTVRALEVRQ